MDVESLYTNIETSKGLEAIRECLQKYPDSTRPDGIILELLKINLGRNDFLYGDEWFLQVKGTAMGKRFSPAYANIYMAKWEEEAFQKCTKLPEAYYRYLDDIWGVWNHNREELDQFIQTLNNHHPSIKVKPTIDPKQVIFLDTITRTRLFQNWKVGHQDTLQTYRLTSTPTQTASITDIHSEGSSNHN